MKLIIAGTRTIDLSIQAIEGFMWVFDLLPKEIVCGGANGVDWSGRNWGVHNNVQVKMFPADWTKYGKMAGHRRNGEMAAYADALLLIWDGKSTGSLNMKQRMEGYKKPIHEVILRGLP